MFERTKSLYKMLSDKGMRRKLQWNDRKSVGKYKFSSEIQ